MALTKLQCITGGVQVESTEVNKYEVCSEGYCILREKPFATEKLLFPPEVTIHRYMVQWKTLDKGRVNVVKLSCPPAPFCQMIQCWFCTATMFNPECNPEAALIAFMIVLYIIIAVIYTLCYVPVVIGKPCRVGYHILQRAVRCGGHLLLRALKGISRRRREYERPDVQALINAPLLAIVFAISITGALTCQDVDIFTLTTKVCSRNSPTEGKCFKNVTKHDQIKHLQSGTCIRVVKNETTLRKYRFLWRGLHLECQKEYDNVHEKHNPESCDSKRCAHTGSCKGSKCEQFNKTSLIPELAPGNKYTGITRCVESCGGPGCGCFYLSSGCLFYRIFHVPDDDAVYEIFRCLSWKEAVELQIQSEDDKGKQVEKTVFLQPTVPVKHGKLRLTLSSLTVPPVPLLNTYFITNGEETAIWNGRHPLLLECESSHHAKNMNCSVIHNCICQPAELRILCNCMDMNLTALFEKQLENRLPVRHPWVFFDKSRRDPSSVSALIPTLVTAELLVTVKEDINMITKEVSNMTCTIGNAMAQGCYRCGQGAVSEVTCFSNHGATRAEIHCADLHFSVPCSQDGEKSEIRFSYNSARVLLRCISLCGSTPTHFEITGILKWTRTIEASVKRIIKGETSIENEMEFPDFGHIFDTILSGYRTMAITAGCFLMAIAVGYIFLWTCGVKILSMIAHLFIRITRFQLQLLKLILGGLIKICRNFFQRNPQRSHAKQM
ncbi:hypothetical protein COOONC_08477 [Cooperia oncophora]